MRGPMQENSLSEIGFVRLAQIVGPAGIIPISRSSFLARVKSGEFPGPVRLGPKTVGWRVADIRGVVDRLESRVGGPSK